jgi:hypothetical protein
VACLVIIAAGLVAWYLKDWDPFTTDEADPATINANAQIELPPSTRDIHVRVSGFREISTHVRFAIDATDLPQFLDSTLCNEPLAPTNPAFQEEGSGDLSWWRPGDAQRLQECVGKRTGFYQHVLVDVSNPDTYIVYVYAGNR